MRSHMEGPAPQPQPVVTHSTERRNESEPRSHATSPSPQVISSKREERRQSEGQELRSCEDEAPRQSHAFHHPDANSSERIVTGAQAAAAISDDDQNKNEKTHTKKKKKTRTKWALGPKMLRIFEPLDFKDAKPKKPSQAYVVQPGDTLAGIALRHGMKEAEVRAMNNLWESNIFTGQQLTLHRKKRSQSLPVLPGAKEFAAEHEQANAKESASRRCVEPTNQTEEEPVVDDDDHNGDHQQSSPQKERKRGALDVILEQAVPPRGFFSSLFGSLLGAEDNATKGPEPRSEPRATKSTTRRLKMRSYSERLPTNQEAQDEVYALPKLTGAVDVDILSEIRYGPKLVPKIEAFLPMSLRGYDWTKLYSLAQHGASLHTLMRKVRGQRSTLVVVETCSGEIFGGFARAQWANSISYYGSGESFVFTNVPTFEVFSWKRTNSMFMYSNDESIAMGGGGGFAWFLNSDLSRGSTAVSETFGNRPLTSESHFEIANVEVWGFAMF